MLSKQKIFVGVMLSAAACTAVGEETGPYSAGFTYTGDFLKNTQGGEERASHYLDLLSLHGDIDTQKAWGHPGGTFHIDYLISHNSFNDTVGTTQAVDNVDFDDAERLYELWYEQQLDDAGSSVKVGLYDVNSEFDSIATAGLFLHSSQGAGIDWSQSGVAGPSFSPLTSVGVRGLWVVDPAWKILATVVDGQPGDHDLQNHHNHIQLREDEGVMSAVEVNESTRVL